MQKKTTLFICLIGLLFAFLPLYAQLDLKEKAQLIGIQVDEKPGANAQEKLTDIAFIFTGKPSAYYHTYKDSILVIEFFDAEPGEEKLPEITQAPFSSSTITKDKVDVNKDIEGMEPLLKDVVRVTLPVQKEINMDYTLSDDFNVVTLSTVWAKGAKIVSTVTRSKTKTIMLIGGGVVGVTAGVITYFFLNDDDKKKETIANPDWNPAPPSLPNTP